MDNFCIDCEKSGTMKNKDIEIKVGREIFQANVPVCSNCGAYEITPEVQDEMDAWGAQFKRNFMAIQPRLSATAHAWLDEYALDKPLTKVEFIRIFTAFYLEDAVQMEDFEVMKKYLEKHENHKLLTEGKKIAISVPVRYEAYKLLETYAEVWDCTPANAIEDAVLFCLSLKNLGDNRKLKALSERLNSFVKKSALAA